MFTIGAVRMQILPRSIIRLLHGTQKNVKMTDK
jgi:hypothetical protein